MKTSSFQQGSIVLLLYMFGGLALGLANRPLGQAVQQLGVKPGVGTAINVNGLLPLLAVGLGVAYPRLATVWLGAVGMTVAFLVALALVHPPPQPWNAATLLRAVQPVLVLACLGYILLGTMAARITCRVRQ
ncbi:MAG TPA: hypothetical protein VKU02_27995 [Gemmataceae bacterium]|nr:hypothetical protein [Gemmataceae bacterium]